LQKEKQKSRQKINQANGPDILLPQGALPMVRRSDLLEFMAGHIPV
jgi:hypothetical protein